MLQLDHWETELTHWATTAPSRPGRGMVLVAPARPGHFAVTLIDNYHPPRSTTIPREKFGELAMRVASGALGPVDLVAVGSPPIGPPKPPPTPVGYPPIIAAQIAARGAIGVLAELVDLQLASELAGR